MFLQNKCHNEPYLLVYLGLKYFESYNGNIEQIFLDSES